jgi:hypothetical protein
VIVFRQLGTAQQSPAFGPFGFVMPNYGAFADTTLYVIIGPFTDKRPRFTVSDKRPQMPFTDKRPRFAVSQPKADE